MKDDLLKTNFLENQAKDISEPAYKKFPVILLMAIFALTVIVGLWQLANMVISYPKIAAAKNIQIKLERPQLKDGSAFVDMEIDNGNDLPLTSVNVKYTIYSTSGGTASEGNISILKDVPAGQKAVAQNVKLGSLSESAGKMHAEVTDAILLGK